MWLIAQVYMVVAGISLFVAAAIAVHWVLRPEPRVPLARRRRPPRGE